MQANEVGDEKHKPEHGNGHCACNIKRKDLFGFIRFIMQMAGMYPLQIQQQLPKYLQAFALLVDFLFEQFLYFVTIHIAIMFICTIYLHYDDGDLELLVNCLIQTTIYIWSILMKFYFRRIRPDRLHQLIDGINETYHIRSYIGLTYVSMDGAFKQSTRWIKIYVYFCFVGTLFWVILPLSYNDRSLPLNCWYPFDIKQSIYYEVIYFLQFIGQLQVAAAFSASSGFFMVLAILLSGQYDILCCNLKNILAAVYIHRKMDAEQMRFLSVAQHIANGESNQYYCSVEHLTPLACLQHNMPPTECSDFQLAFKYAFRTCVDLHRNILSILNRVEQFYSPIWFFKFGEMIFLMCLVAFVSVKSTSTNSSFMKMVTLGQYLMLIAWELLIICYFGEIIFKNSQRCDEALLRSPWYLHITEMKREFLFFLMNSQRPFKLTAGKLFALNTERARVTITTAFSFLTLLQKMDNRK